MSHTLGPVKFVKESEGSNPQVAHVRMQILAGGARIGWLEYVPPHDVGAAYVRLFEAAPALWEALANLVQAAQSVPLLKEPPWTVSDVASAVPMMRALEKARVLLNDPDSRAWAPEAEATIAQAEGDKP